MLPPRPYPLGTADLSLSGMRVTFFSLAIFFFSLFFFLLNYFYFLIAPKQVGIISAEKKTRSAHMHKQCI